MESNEQTELTRKMGTDTEMESRMTAKGVGMLGCGGIEQKQKRGGMDNSVVIAGGRGI